MAERDKLNAISRAWSQPEKEAFARGASGLAPKVQAPVLGVERRSIKLSTPAEQDPAVDANVADMQAANLLAAKTDPGVQERLNMVARELEKMRMRNQQK